MNDIKPIVAKNIAELRQSHKMTQLELAERLSYSDKAVSKWERGESLPDIAVLVEIADMFCVPLDYLVRAEHKAPKPEPTQPPRYNRVTIAWLSVLLVLFVACLVFVVISVAYPELSFKWLAFVYAVPTASVVWLVLNSIWFNKRRNYAIISLLVWSLLAAAHLSALPFGCNIWLIYLLGIPAELIIIAWSMIKKPTDTSKADSEVNL